MSAANVAVAVKVRWGAQLLKELTNEDGSASTINDTVLEAAAADSIGEFERVVGLLHDDTNATHLGILCRGTLYFLEFYKARDTGMLKSRSSDFYAALTNFRKIATITAQSTSNLTIDREASGTRADMDRNRKLFQMSNNTEVEEDD